MRKSHKELMDELCPPKSVDPLTLLPRELAEFILEHLSFRQRMNACLVSKQWAHFIRSVPNLWQHLDLSGARKKVRSAFISRAINIGRSKLTKASLNELYDFDKTLIALVKHCPLEELELCDTGLQCGNLGNILGTSKHFKKLRARKGTTLGGDAVRSILERTSLNLEVFDCQDLILRVRFPSRQEITWPNLHTFSATFENGEVTVRFFREVISRMPSLEYLTIKQQGLGTTRKHIDLSRCTKLKSLDLAVMHTRRDVFTFPSSLVRLRLEPTLADGSASWQSVIGPTTTVNLPNLEELTLEARGDCIASVVVLLLEHSDKVH